MRVVDRSVDRPVDKVVDRSVEGLWTGSWTGPGGVVLESVTRVRLEDVWRDWVVCGYFATRGTLFPETDSESESQTSSG